MPKLWIVHRESPNRAALIRLAGLPADAFAAGSPSSDDFGPEFERDGGPPTAILMGLESDFERELDFAHRMTLARRRAGHPPAQWILLADVADHAEVQRLFGPLSPQIFEALPPARSLRDGIAAAFSRGAGTQSASLSQRRTHRRIADRFSAWLGAVEVPGLLRALDPSLGSLPLLVRGVRGSGRALTARYIELFRTPSPGAGLASSPDPADGAPSRLRIHADEAEAEPTANETTWLSRRIAQAQPPATIWIDDVDALSAPTQRALSEWIIAQDLPDGLQDEAAQWIATAGPARWRDPLEPDLARAFSPLILEIPSLADQPETIASFAEEIAKDWSRSLGGAPRSIHPRAISALQEQIWPGDRAELESVLRAALAATTREEVDLDDLAIPREGETFSPAPVSEAAPDTRASTPAEDPAPVDDLLSEEDFILGEEITDDPSEIDLEDEAPALGSAAGPGEAEPAIEWGRTTENPPLMSDAADLSAFSDASAPDTQPTAESGALPDLESLGAALLSETRDPAPETPLSDSALPEVKGDADESIRLADASFALAQETEENWRRLARSLAHEIRNPLVSIRTFAELLPDNHEDETFRERFVELVGRDVRHIDEVVGRMQSVASQERAESEAVDVSALLEELLVSRRREIQERRLLVLRELERESPLAWAESNAVRAVLAGLLDRALDTLPERGDLFIATRYLERGSEGEPRLRTLLRYHSPELANASSELDELSPAANVLEYVLAETVAHASGGSFAIDSSDARETLILLDLKTPSESRPRPGAANPA